MPASTRDWARRKLDQARDGIDWPGKHLADVINMYENPHPEISEPLRKIASLLEIAQESIDKVRREL